MRLPLLFRRAANIFAAVLLAAALPTMQSQSAPGVEQPTILYGAAYYNEYMPADLQPGRLEKGRRPDA